MVSGLLVGGFVEFPDEFFEGASHFEVGDNVGVQVGFRELLNELEQAVGFIELLDLLVEAEVIEQFAGLGREAMV